MVVICLVVSLYWRRRERGRGYPGAHTRTTQTFMSDCTSLVSSCPPHFRDHCFCVISSRPPYPALLFYPFPLHSLLLFMLFHAPVITPLGLLIFVFVFVPVLLPRFLLFLLFFLSVISPYPFLLFLLLHVTYLYLISSFLLLHVLASSPHALIFSSSSSSSRLVLVAGRSLLRGRPQERDGAGRKTRLPPLQSGQPWRQIREW